MEPRPKNIYPAEYCGYGVYIEFNELGEFTLRVEREEGTHWIAITPDELAVINRFVKRHTGV